MAELSDSAGPGGVDSREDVNRPPELPDRECFASPIVREVMDYFIVRGWPPVQAAGIVANLQAASDLRPEAAGDGGLVYGLTQWSPERQAAFQVFAGHSMRVSTFAEQLSFVQHELTSGGEIWAGRRLRSAISASQAGAFVSRFYARPRDLEGESDRRGLLAEHIFRTYLKCR